MTRLIGSIAILAAALPAFAGPTTLPKGTPVKMVLLRELAAGRDKAGEAVPLMVLEDVKDASGMVVIPRGSTATAVIQQSRSEGMLSGLVNRPARLIIKLETTKAIDGQPVPLTQKLEPNPEPLYAFSKVNTGIPKPSEQFAELMKDQQNVETFEQVSMMFRAGEGDPLKKLPDGKDPLDQIANVLGMPNTAAVIKEGRKSELQKVLAALRRNRAAWNSLASGLSISSAAAVIELAKVAGSFGWRGGLLRGKTLRAHPGTEINAVVADNVTIQLPDGA